MAVSRLLKSWATPPAVAHRLHLLRLAQLILELSALLTSRVQDDGPDRRVVESIDADPFHDPPRTVCMLEADFCRDVEARARERFRHAGAGDISIVGMKKRKDRLTQHLFRRPSEVTMRRCRDVSDATFPVSQQQRVRTVLDQGAKAFFAGAQRFFGLPALAFLRVQRERMLIVRSSVSLEILVLLR